MAAPAAAAAAAAAWPAATDAPHGRRVLLGDTMAARMLGAGCYTMPLPL